MEPPYQARAIYEYKSEHADDLNFSAGQIISVEAVEDEEWLRGSFDDDGTKLSGIFPKSFVEACKPATRSVSVRPDNHTTAVVLAQDEDNAVIEPPSEIQGETKDLVEELHDLDVTEKSELSLEPTIEVAPIPGNSKKVSQKDNELDSLPEKAPVDDKDSQKPIADAGAMSESAIKQARTKSPLAAAENRNLDTATVENTVNSEPRKPNIVDSSQKPEGKPVKSNAFRDRIAAFNKQEAAPIAPKPLAKPSFAKKPFIAPPPSRDAYVPSPAQNKPRLVPATNITKNVVNRSESEPIPQSSSIEDAPKIGSLKDRIAALQAERAQTAAKKSTPTPDVSAADTEELTDKGIHKGQDTASTRLVIAADIISDETIVDEGKPRQSKQPPTVPATSQSLDEELVSQDEAGPAPVHKEDSIRSTGPGSIEALAKVPSGTATTESRLPFRPETIEADERISAPGPPITTTPTPKQERPTSQRLETAEKVSDKEREEAEQEEEISIDPEELRKQQLRERMAKMSGGMGMGMHMALGLPSAKPRTAPISPPHRIEKEESTAQYSPIPIPMPGMQLPTNHRTEDDNGVSSSSTTDRGTSVTVEAQDHEPIDLALASPPSVPLTRAVAELSVSSDSTTGQLNTNLATLAIEQEQARDSIPPTTGPETLTPGQVPPRPTAHDSPQRAPPITYSVPPIPSGRPAEPRPLPPAAPPAIPPNRPIAQRHDSGSSVQSTNQNTRNSIEYARIPPPPVPMGIPPRPAGSSPSLQHSPSDTPGNNKRAS